jgi:O-antigen ligase
LLPSTQALDLKVSAAMALAFLFCLGLALRVPTAGGRADLRKPPRALFLAWAAAGLASCCAWAASPYAGLVGLADAAAFAAACAAACICFGLASGPRAWTSTILRFWRLATLAVAAYAVAQRFGVEPMDAYAQAGSRARAMGSFGNPGYLAAFLCLSWPLLLVFGPKRRAAALALVFVALLATQSRAALLALGVQALGLGFLAWRRRCALGTGGPESGSGAGAGLRGAAGIWGAARSGRAPLLLLLAALGLPALAAAFLFPQSQWLRPTLRLPLWRAALGLWLQRPWLGWGPGSFPLAFQDHGDARLVGIVNAGHQYAEDPHQLLLAVACAGGLLALAVLGLACALFFREVRRSPLPEAAALGLGVLGLLVQSQADRFFFLPGLLVPLCASLGMLAWRENKPSGAVSGRSGVSGLAGGRAALAEASSWIFLLAGFGFVWLGAAPVLRYGQGVGSSLDAGASALAAAGDPAALAAQALRDKQPLTYERLGDALAAGHHYDQAAEALAKALALQPTRGRAQNLGDCYIMLGDARQAEKAFRLAVSLEPGSADAHFSLGYALFYEKRLKEAVAELDTALRLDPKHAGAAQLKRQILQ